MIRREANFQPYAKIADNKYDIVAYNVIFIDSQLFHKDWHTFFSSFVIL